MNKGHKKAVEMYEHEKKVAWELVNAVLDKYKSELREKVEGKRKPKKKVRMLDGSWGKISNPEIYSYNQALDDIKQIIGE